MQMTEEEQVLYLANIASVAKADGVLSPREEAAIEGIRSALGAKKSSTKAALTIAESPAFQLSRVGTFATQVTNLSDMLHLCFIDGELAERESRMISDFCKIVGIYQDQLDLLVNEAYSRAARFSAEIACPSCKAAVAADARFCPKCGTSLVATQGTAETASVEVPKSGYAIEFAESTASSFQDALAEAKRAPFFSASLKGKKSWFIAAWPEGTIMEVIKLADLLSGIRNKKCFVSGSEADWNATFGFMWCAGTRGESFNPAEYCFGRTENRLNPWGCIQAQMDWTEWANWFSYGHYQPQSYRNGRAVWIFDRARIRHELLNNLQGVKSCPFLRPSLVEAVLEALPEKVDVSSNGQWQFKRSYDEVPGGIHVVEIEGGEGFEFRNEYYSAGVKPNGLGPLRAILQKAFSSAEVSDVSVKQIAG